MGDYTKIIVNCSLNKMNEEAMAEFRQEFNVVMGLTSSAYHCGGEIFHMDNEWHHRTDLTIVTQDKYGSRLDAFIEWLKPQVISGSGERDCFALAFTEYSKTPTLYFVRDEVIKEWHE